MKDSVISHDREELGKYLGSTGQLAGIRRVVLDDGRGRGCRLAEVNNGSGLEFTVNCERGLDVADVRFKGVPLAWMSRTGIVNPSYYEPEEFNWLRSFTGGLVSTCGLRNVGGPGEVNGEKFGLHGRIGHLPGESVNTSSEWQDGVLTLAVSGVVRESRVFGENLVLKRKYTTGLGSNQLVIDDEITNEDANPTPFMMLYHMNFGYPLVAPGAVIETVQPHPVTPANPAAKANLAKYAEMEAPQHGFTEQVFCHELPAGDCGYASVTLKNPALGLAVRVSYRTRELPYLVEWKQMGEGDYVLGLEPGNCFPFGQAKFAETGKLRILQPGETVRHSLILDFIEL